jgi:tetratricopeptide (TPR) repeat protein
MWFCPLIILALTMREDIRLYNLALDCDQVGDWEAAIAKLHRAIEDRPQEAEYHSLLAVAYLGCCDKALPTPDSTLEQSRQMYTHLARLAFRRALALNRNDPILSKYLNWLLDSLDNDHPDDHPPYPDPAPRSPQPNFPSSSTAANLIDAASIAQIP